MENEYINPATGCTREEERFIIITDLPPAFHTHEAVSLFLEAIKNDIIEIGEGDHLTKSPRITKAQLAYWCQQASTYLDLNKGQKEYTNWKEFEKVFGYPGSTPLRKTLHNITSEEYTKAIDDFFMNLYARKGNE